MQLHLKQTFPIFLIFFLLQQAYGQSFYQLKQDVPLSENGNTLSMPWAGGLNSALLQSADLDGDGSEELISLDRSSQSMMVFAYEEGDWMPAPELLCLLPADLRNWFIMEDYDGDGRKDIFTFTAAGIRVFKNEATAGEEAFFILISETLTYQSNDREVNLLVNSSDVPAIADVDEDGDLDILIYDPTGGGGLFYYRNLSVENGGEEPFAYIRESNRWGGLSECECGIFAYNDEACENKGSGHRLMHAGGKSLLLYDVDGDGALDLLNGFEECAELYYLKNSGTNTSPRFNGYQTQLPGSDVAVDMIFPAAFAIDADRDGLQDIIISSQLNRNSNLLYDFSESIWLYTSSTDNGQSTYSLQTKAFLQEEMLDVGEMSIPAFMDLDADGDQELLLGSYGDPAENGFYAGLKLYENTGSADAPAFTLMQDDYLGLKSFRYFNLSPQFVDFDGDGSQDLVITATETERYQRKAYVYLNEAERNQPAQFREAGQELPFSFSTQDHPVFYDISGDGLADMLIGRFDGSLSYYRNTGSVQAASFGSETKNFMGFGLDNYRRPLSPSISDLSGNGQPDLLLADGTGSLRYVPNFLAQQNGSVEPETISVCEGSENQAAWFGRRSFPVAVKLQLSAPPALVIGNMLGGLWMLGSGAAPAGPGNDLQLTVFPNPVSAKGERLYVLSNKAVNLRLVNIQGQLLQVTQVEAGQSVRIDPSGLVPGMYLLQAVSESGKRSAKLIVIE